MSGDEKPSAISDEEMRKLLKPNPTEEDALRILKTSYVNDDEAESKSSPRCKILKQLDSYDDCNFKVEIDGEPYLLKFHNGVESSDFVSVYKGADNDYYKQGHAGSVIHLQNAIMEKLKQRNILTSVPVKPVNSTVPVSIHSVSVLSPTHSPCQLVVRLFAWVPGRPMSAVKLLPLEALADAGRLLGKVDKALDEMIPDCSALQLLRAESEKLLKLSSLQQQADSSSQNDTDTQAIDKHLQDASLMKAARRYHQWDGQHTADLRKFVHCITDDKRRGLVESVLDAFENDLIASEVSLNFRKGINHGDFNDANIMMDDDLNVSAVIDFGDSTERFVDRLTKTVVGGACVILCQSALCLKLHFDEPDRYDGIKAPECQRYRVSPVHGDAFPRRRHSNISEKCRPKYSISSLTHMFSFFPVLDSWRVLDVSVAMTYGMLSVYGKANRSISAAAAVLRGYNSVYPLTDTERKHLVLLMACRLACSATLGAFSYQQNPGNEYLLLHAEPAWKALELIWGYCPEKRANLSAAFNRAFQQACLYTDSTEKIITCYDLVMPDPSVADLLQTVRVPSIFDTDLTPRKKRKLVRSKNDSGSAQITFVTGNAKKLEEVKRILGMENGNSLPFQLINMKVDLPELQGKAMDVAREKCLAAAEKVGGPVIVEDTSLCFNALNGMPGVFIKWFLDSCGHDGLNRMIADFDDKTAYAQTVVAFSLGPGHAPAVFDGRTAGKIVPPRGKLDFGWDPIFEPDEGEGKTYAEMSKEAKDAISHRSRAFVQAREYLNRFQADILKKIG